MELEKVKEKLKELLKYPVWYVHTGKDEDFLRKIDKTVIETVLNQLEQYKKLYVQASAQMLNNSIINNKVTNEQLEALNEGWKLENEKLQADLYEANNIISDYIDTTAKQEKMIEILLDLYWNKEQARLFIEYGLENKEQLRKEIEKKTEESE